MPDEKRKLYQASYRTELEEPATPEEESGSTTDTSTEVPATPEDGSWKKRYGDLRSHTNSLTERVKQLETQLTAAQKKDIQIPSSKEELVNFASRYPDVYRHIRSIALQELLQERENLAQETTAVREDLEKVKRERGYQRILQAHPDFEEINLSEQFHGWAQVQPKQIQDWLFEESDPDLCIKALDLFKAEAGFKKKQQRKPSGADTMVNTRSTVELPEQGDKRIWKASDIGKLHPKQFEKFEAEIEKARAEGRVDSYA